MLSLQSKCLNREMIPKQEYAAKVIEKKKGKEIHLKS